MSNTFNLDASSYGAYQIPDEDITYTIPTTTVQELGPYTVSIESPVPLEISSAGCFLKLIFPKELQVSDELSAFEGSELLVDSSGGSTITPLTSVTSGDTKYVVFQGCTDMSMHN